MVFIRYKYLFGPVARTNGGQGAGGEAAKGERAETGVGGDQKTHPRGPGPRGRPSPTQRPGHHRQRGAQDQDGHAVADDLWGESRGHWAAAWRARDTRSATRRRSRPRL